MQEFGFKLELRHLLPIHCLARLLRSQQLDLNPIHLMLLVFIHLKERPIHLRLLVFIHLEEHPIG